jgi:glycosyltransferase involved in cell wall biosynthesis
MPGLKKAINPLEKYLAKHKPAYRIDEDPRKDLGIIVVVPAYIEGDHLFETLESILRCDAPQKGVEIIIVLNASEADALSVVETQKACLQQLNHFKAKGVPFWLTIHHLEAYDLRKKHFGAGLARKTGLDEAVRRFSKLERPEGVLVCLDADSPVAANYFTTIEHWADDAAHHGAIIHFEHPTEGETFPPQVYEAIVLYELHLRYYRMALEQTGFPYAFHTIGSCMVFRALKYVQAGGMPKKQAGEDFYFLQKLIPLGGFGTITSTTVYPSPRPSNRVIFGTGASIKQHIEGTRKQGTTYHPAVFEDLRNFFSRAHELAELSPAKFESWTYQLTGPLRSFLLNTNFTTELINIQQNSNSEKTFLKRFFGIFNAFKVIRYFNYAHEHFYARTDVFEAALLPLQHADIDTSAIFDEKELLLKYRTIETSSE